MSLRRASITWDIVLWPLFVVFLVTTATGWGPYSTQYGPYWAAFLVAAVAALLGTHPKQVAHLTCRPVALVGLSFFAFLWLAAMLTQAGTELRLAMPMFMQGLCYLLALWFGRRYAATKLMFWPVVATCVLAVGANLYEGLIAPQTWSVSPGRAAGFFVNPNNSGAEITLLASLALIGRPRIGWMLTSALIVAAFAAVLVTFSRGAIIEFAILLGLVRALRWQEGQMVKASTLAPLAAAVFSAYVLVGWLLSHPTAEGADMRLHSLLTADFSDDSSRGRSDALSDYTQMVLEHPVFGERPFGSLAETSGRGPHNSFVALAADFGAVPACVVILMISLAIRGAYRTRWRGGLAQTLMVVATWMFVSSMFSHNVFYSAYGALAAGLAIGALSRQEPMWLSRRRTV